MKKTLLVLLCLMIILSGCQTGSSMPVQTAPHPNRNSGNTNPDSALSFAAAGAGNFLGRK